MSKWYVSGMNVCVRALVYMRVCVAASNIMKESRKGTRGGRNCACQDEPSPPQSLRKSDVSDQLERRCRLLHDF